MKYYVDSKGLVVEKEDFFKLKKTTEWELASRLDALIKKSLFQTPYFKFCDCMDYMVSLNKNQEKILFFSKIPLSASSDVVKKANLAVSQSNFQYSNKREKDILNSIFATNINHKTEWWLVSAEFLSLEHNIYDKCFISLHHNSIPYAEFLNNLNSYIVQDKFQFISAKQRNYNNIDEIIYAAVLKNSNFKADFSKIMGTIIKSEQITNIDINSNDKNKYFQLIEEKPENIYIIFTAFKSFIKKNCKNTVFVNYRKNVIQFKDDNGVHQIWVSGTIAAPVFMMYGNIYYGADSFKKSLKNGSCFIPSKWYEDIKEYVNKTFDMFLSKNQPKIETEELDW